MTMPSQSKTYDTHREIDEALSAAASAKRHQYSDVSRAASITRPGADRDRYLICLDGDGDPVLFSSLETEEAMTGTSRGLTRAGAQGAFTPGPWTVDLRGERGTFHIPEAQRHEASAADADGMDGYTVSKANARLIAAAPDLHAALVEGLRFIEDWMSAQGYPEHVEDWCDMHGEADRFGPAEPDSVYAKRDRLRAALIKATGGA